MNDVSDHEATLQFLYGYVAGVRFRRKKGSFGVGTQKMGAFWCGLSKMGVIQFAKMQFQGKICKFSVQIATKIVKFLKNVREAHKNVQFLCKIWYKSGKKGVIGCGLNKKRGSLGVGSA